MSDPAFKMEVAEPLRMLIIGIATSLVDHPEMVEVRIRQELASTTLILRVNPDDLGKIIGKQGRTARSIRTILAAASMKVQHRFELDIAESTPAVSEALAS